MKKSISLIAVFLGLCWGSFILSYWLPLQHFGIIPRTEIGLIGILSAPFLHGSLPHLTGNSVSFVVFALIFSALNEKNQWPKMIVMALLTGALTWLMARDANHIGASGLIFAMFAYLIFAGWFSRQLRYILIAVLVIFLYGGMIYGVLPGRVGVSWESHLFGFISGIFVAWYSHGKKP